jgi:hypothetical protein
MTEKCQARTDFGHEGGASSNPRYMTRHDLLKGLNGHRCFPLSISLSPAWIFTENNPRELHENEIPINRVSTALNPQ